MTPEQIALVERTVPAEGSRMTAIAADFYDRLFAAAPELRDLFTHDPAAQRAKFAAELQTILLTIRRHGDFLGRAGALGARHAGYGVHAAHYRTVGDALLAAMAVGLPPDRGGDDGRRGRRRAEGRVAAELSQVVQRSPRRVSAASSCSRPVTPSLVYAFCRWLSTVRTDRYSLAAMSRLACPRAASRTISRSRRVNGTTAAAVTSAGVRAPSQPAASPAARARCPAAWRACPPRW